MKIRFLIFVTVFFLFSCTSPQPVENTNNTLTHGNVQMNLVVGKTTQADVLEVFGAPNITTIDGTGREVWTYQRHATVSQSSKNSSYFNILLVGQRATSSGFEQSSRTMTLIIKFNKHKIVDDFKSRSSSF